MPNSRPTPQVRRLPPDVGCLTLPGLPAIIATLVFCTLSLSAGCQWLKHDTAKALGELQEGDLTALKSPAPAVRLEAVLSWPTSDDRPLPPALTELRQDSDPRVRATVLKVIAAKHDPQALAWLTAALADREAQVRLAAIAGLGALGGTEAEAVLRDLRQKQPEAVRAAAVSALAACGAEDVLADACKDSSWRVRQAAAEALGRFPSRPAAALAESLLDDPSGEVHRCVLESVAQWPLDKSGPVLLAAMDKNSLFQRQTAARLLAARWPPAGEFPAETSQSRRREVLGGLRDQFRREHGFADRAAVSQALSSKESSRQSLKAETLVAVGRHLAALGESRSDEAKRQEAIAGLRALGAQLPPAIEQVVFQQQTAVPEVVYCEALSSQGAVWEALAKLASSDPTDRRHGADALAAIGGNQPLGRLAVARLNELIARQQDPLLWIAALSAISNDPSDEANQLARTAAGHPQPEVRRRGCAYLAAYPQPAHAEALVAALSDESPSVTAAAARALGGCGPLGDTSPLKRLLRADNEMVRFEAAHALTRLGDAAGKPALERMAYSKDPAIRRQAADAMGQIADAEFLPTLIQLLDDQAGVQRVALHSLSKVAGRDVTLEPGRPAPTTDEQVRRWKTWFRRSQNVAPQRP